ncbi:MAG: thiamine biosynthesis protein thio [Gammaproteobacteria bacterium RIFCSPHIGHO2_12_FULL_37_14]|nr:MAG: thiamine biosynthesis protein thio [Gammaproteobacteria bacterium RIFCSPHIGHO2_12_FULL_37_14]
MKVAIVGAGIMGRLLALSLVNAGYNVNIFDQDHDSGMNSCSMAAAGLLTPMTELDKSEMIIYELGMKALAQHWPNILAELQDNIYFQCLGSIVLNHPKDHPEMDRYIALIRTKIKNSVFQKLNQSSLRELEPSLTKFNEAYYFPDEGQLDNQHILDALKKKLLAKQVTWHQQTFVRKIQPGMVCTESSSFQFDMVFDCRGIGAKSVFHDLQGIRGELIWLHAPEVQLKRPVRFLHPRYSVYVVPRRQNIYLLGASEITSEDQSAISVRTTLELLTAAYYLHPGFAEATILKTVTHCRPTLANYLPRIKYTAGWMAINGLYRHGFLIAPTLVAEIMQWLINGNFSSNYAKLWERV